MIYSNYLMHYGIKGMKWGVRRYQNEDGTLTEAGKQHNHDRKVLRDALNSGEIRLDMNRGAQMKHIKDSQFVENGRGFIEGNLNTIKKLIKDYSGTGTLVYNGKEWLKKERVVLDQPIAFNKVLDDNNNVIDSYYTKNAMIMYSKKGTHIRPRADEKGKVGS